MSMRIQEVLSNCCDGIKDFASSAASWIGKTVTATGSFLIEGTAKVAQLVKPHFDKFRTFAQENRQALIVAAVAFAVGAIISTVVNDVFCRNTDPTTPPPGTGVTAGATGAGTAVPVVVAPVV